MEQINCVSITHKCNWNCPWCISDTHKTLKEMNTGENEGKLWKDALNRIKTQDNIVISGGEPGLVSIEDWITIGKILEKENKKVIVNTNGKFVELYYNTAFKKYRKFIKTMNIHITPSIEDWVDNQGGYLFLTSGRAGEIKRFFRNKAHAKKLKFNIVVDTSMSFNKFKLWLDSWKMIVQIRQFPYFEIAVEPMIKNPGPNISDSSVYNNIQFMSKIKKLDNGYLFIKCEQTYLNLSSGFGTKEEHYNISYLK